MKNFQFPISNFQKRERGFTLLIAVIFMSVMLSFGLALGALAYKQQVLASSAIESQYAFYAADAALECALYEDQQLSRFTYNASEPASIPGNAPSMTCDGQSPTYSQVTYRDASKWVIKETVSLDNGTRCADVTIVKLNGTQAGEYNYIFSQGYDVSCATVASPEGKRFNARGVSVRY
jgi:Tfp pilus assembly protein PilX